MRQFATGADAPIWSNPALGMTIVRRRSQMHGFAGAGGQVLNVDHQPADATEDSSVGMRIDRALAALGSAVDLLGTGLRDAHLMELLLGDS